MTRWFAVLPIHRKLVVASMAVTALTLLVTMTALVVIDVVRFHAAATADARGLATIVAENTRAAMTFGDHQAALDTLETLRVRGQVRRACLYDTDGRLYAEYRRDDGVTCPAARPDAIEPLALAALMPIVNRGEQVGVVYLDRDWSSLVTRIRTTAVTTVAVLVLVSFLMLAVAHRLHRRISAPITELAAAVEAVGRNGSYEKPALVGAARRSRSARDGVRGDGGPRRPGQP